MVKNLPASAGDARDRGLSPGLGRSSGERNGNPVQYSYLGNPYGQRGWYTTVHGIESDTTERACMRARTCTHTHTQTHSFSKLVLKSSFLCHCNSTLLHYLEITTFEFLQLIFMELSPYLRVIYIHYVFLIFPS